jgi:hypothetical protein
MVAFVSLVMSSIPRICAQARFNIVAMYKSCKASASSCCDVGESAVIAGGGGGRSSEGTVAGMLAMESWGVVGSLALAINNPFVK